MSILVFLIYIGGVWGLSDDVSWWKTMCWPYYLGKRLGAESEKAMPAKKAKSLK